MRKDSEASLLTRSRTGHHKAAAQSSAGRGPSEGQSGARAPLRSRLPAGSAERLHVPSRTAQGKTSPGLRSPPRLPLPQVASFLLPRLFAPQKARRKHRSPGTSRSRAGPSAVPSGPRSRSPGAAPPALPTWSRGRRRPPRRAPPGSAGPPEVGGERRRRQAGSGESPPRPRASPGPAPRSRPGAQRAGRCLCCRGSRSARGVPAPLPVVPHRARAVSPPLRGVPVRSCPGGRCSPEVPLRGCRGSHAQGSLLSPGALPHFACRSALHPRRLAPRPGRSRSVPSGSPAPTRSRARSTRGDLAAPLSR